MRSLANEAVVYHPKYGRGVVVVGGHHNIAVKFDKGGPMGFAPNATNDIADLFESKAAMTKELKEREDRAKKAAEKRAAKK